MAGTHVTGPVKSEGGIYAATAFNIKPFISVGAAVSTITITGLAATDVIASAFKVSNIRSGTMAVSNLTAYAVAASNALTLTGKAIAASQLVFGFYIDVSDAS